MSVPAGGGNVIGYWPKEKLETLLDEYQKRPVLWDTKLKSYSSRPARNKAYFEIGQIIDESRDSVARKMKNLRSHYTAEIKKMEESKLTDGPPYISHWWLFKRFSFIKEYPLPKIADNDWNKIRTAVNAVEGDSTLQKKNQVNSSVPTATYIIKLNNNNSIQESKGVQLQLKEICSEQCPPSINEILKQPFQPSMKRKLTVDVATQTSDALKQNILCLMPSLPSNNDALDNYAKYISAEMRSIPDPEQQQLLKMKFQQLLYYAHKGWLQESEN